MGNLVNHAKFELEKAGLYKEDSDYGGLIGKAVEELIKVFAKQEHSGFSAGMTTSLFGKLSRFEPITPLTGEPDEWTEVCDGLFQNRKCSRVFKDDSKDEGKAYDIEGKIFRAKNGAQYTTKDSHTPVVFPYMPKTEYVDITE